MIDRVTEEYFTEDFAAYKTEKRMETRKNRVVLPLSWQPAAEAGCTPQWRNSSFR